jgi:cysteinyl-tRNA synthetase
MPSSTSQTAKLQLYNSLTARKELFVPQDPSRITLYACGPTVYDYAHIGNARSAVVFDVLYRLLIQLYGNDAVVYARNITDVDDKIIARFQAEPTRWQADDAGGKAPIDLLTDFFAAAYARDLASLGCLTPNHEPRARENLPQILQLIEQLLANGFAYVAEGHVLFAVDRFANYGQLAKRRLEEMIAGARVEVAPYKKNPCDFVLWKPSDALDGASFASPWGLGRPGWHIECSAMIAACLGETIDIHAGGADLKFPHHENEIAQSCCAHQTEKLASYWLHNGFLTVNGEKMSKSLGNFLYAWQCWQQEEVGGKVATWCRQPQAVRMQLLSAHYRQPLDWTTGDGDPFAAFIDKSYRLFASFDTRWWAESTAIPLSHIPGDHPVLQALLDDLNTPLALTQMAALYQKAAKATKPEQQSQLAQQLWLGGQMLGLFQESPAEYSVRARAIAQPHTDAGLANDAEVIEILQQRARFRAEKHYAEADRCKQQLLEWQIEWQDTADGTLWKHAHELGWRQLL